MLLLIQVATIMLVIGQARGAGQILLLALGFAMLSPWFWATLLGIVVARKDD
jgi:hypothetical protein